MPIIHIKTSSSDEASILFDKITSQKAIIKYTAKWCGPCKMIAPVFEKYSDDPIYSSIIFAEVDIDELPDIVKWQHITSVPTFQAFCNHSAVDQFAGARKDSLKMLIMKLL